MTFDELKDKALTLPLAPGVYIMRDKDDRVIYVGKAKKLKNRVSQYFQDSASHTPKTRIMVSKIHHFDVIVAGSEFEALVLECSLIKRHLPQYNILLKDDKGYPYLRLDRKAQYPVLTMVSGISDDGADYYGPFGSRGVTQSLLDTIRLTLKLPSCKKQFPRDIGKGRPCLNYHMNNCSGWCRNEMTQGEYRVVIDQLHQLLSGNYKQVSTSIREQMLSASDDLNFEFAASLRDRLNAVEALGQKQLVTAGTLADTDVIGYAQTAAKACFAVLHFSGGNLLDKDYEVFSVPENPETAVSSLMKQYYLGRGFAPKHILLPFAVEDSDLFARLLEQNYNRKTNIRVPVKGDNRRLVELANTNATEEAQRVTTQEDHIAGSLQLLGKMLAIDPPVRIESFDISNISGTDIVASMVVFCQGKPKKGDYKKFKITDLQQDDYGSMRQVLQRRFSRYVQGDAGFDALPDLLLIDGGINHAAIAEAVLKEYDLSVPVYGMVKDDRHRTRALVNASGAEISIANNQTVFALVGNIQEETHNFAIHYHRQLRSKRLRYSELDNIEGIGPKRKEELLKKFKSISAISQATMDELCRILPRDAATHVYQHFKDKEER